MEWVKKGFIFKPDGSNDYLHSHIIPLGGLFLSDKIRMFITSKSKPDFNGNFISHTSFIDLDPCNPQNILYQHDLPILQLGSPGTFDEFGNTVAKPVFFNNKIYLYYLGWQRLSGATAPYQVSLGLAISDDNGFSFNKVSNGPIVGIDAFDPISIGNVSVQQEGGLWKMWYTSYKRWEFNGNKPTPEYNIKYATSNNGIKWEKTGIVSIEENKLGGVATPTVIKIKNKYHLWFGYRNAYSTDGSVGGYKIGYASSYDGVKWERDDDNVGIHNSESGWDSQMICYPHVFAVKDKILMFYCGNDFGKDGFGYAELKVD